MPSESLPDASRPVSHAGWLLALSFACLLAACGPAPTAPAAAPGDAAETPAAVPIDRTPAPSEPSPPPSPGVPVDPPAADPAEPTLPPPPTGADLPSLTVGNSSAESTRGADVDSPILRAVRTGVQPGADRLVFEFEGRGLPKWHIEYVDRPVYDCGAGEAIRLPGDAWLMVRFSGARAHDDAGQGTTGPKLRTLDHPNLIALARICDFEAEVTWVAAVRTPKGYTPRVLADPSRLVVDIAH